MNFPLMVGVVTVAAIMVEAIILFFLLPMLEAAGAVRKNYQARDIPVSAGLSFPVTLIIICLFFAFLNYYHTSYHLFILGLIFISFLGFIDDMLGQRDTLGFKGHFGALFRGRLTTGGLKALGGGLISLFTAFFISPAGADIIINTLLLALFTNMLNLFDLRPGRAIKAFLFFLLILAILGGGRVDYLLIAPLLGAVLAYFKIDLRAQAMMGDSGSNVLGFTLGYLAATSLSLSVRLGLLVFLVLIHLYTEKYSLSTLIDNNFLLGRIDKWGRSR